MFPLSPNDCPAFPECFPCVSSKAEHYLLTRVAEYLRTVFANDQLGELFALGTRCLGKLYVLDQVGQETVLGYFVDGIVVAGVAALGTRKYSFLDQGFSIKAFRLIDAFDGKETPDIFNRMEINMFRQLNKIQKEIFPSTLTFYPKFIFY
ncbi:hypothetical protein BpHYR1_002264 [Brachionus plicatilis]|uniref:Uncharacterized protein n=1 Tax=Brachionus plicatilis TaxID=10195 RepID=A0A3M7SM72_BRAPC|nr:hypothetical protein BpHYR1_002264 [Brachionus plicatilis]